MGMAMGGGGPHGGAGWGLMRSMRRDETVTDYKLPPGITRRIAEFRAPLPRPARHVHRVDRARCGVGRQNPLILRAIIDDGIIKHHSHLVVVLALIVGAARRCGRGAVVVAALGVGPRR